MIKNSLLMLTMLTLNLNLLADDVYVLSYAKDTNCTLTKNSKTIPFFDPKFGKMNPNFGYTCTSIQKEQYNKCKILKSENISALMFSYGSYEYTNNIIAIRNPFPSVKSSITVTCTKNIPTK